MNIAPNSYSRTRKRLLAAAASVAVAGVIGVGALTSGTSPVLADAVRVEAPQVQGFADVVERVSPAVVSVKVKAKIQPTADDGSDGQDGFDNLPNNPQLRRFFKEFRGFGDQGGQDDEGHRRFGHRDHSNDQPRPVAQGSGFFISEDGYLVTNNHVVEEGTAFTVVTNDGKELDAKLVGTDPRTDLAVLKVEGGGKFTYVDFADDSKVRVGDWVVAVGNPFGLGGTVTAGIVSARGRDIGAGPYDDFLQIDASVNRGNSGGPTFNLNGQVVGINTAIFSPNGGNVGIAFDIPAKTVQAITSSLIKTGTVTRGFLDVKIQDVTHDIADSVGLKDAKGALITDVTAGGPGEKAGLKSGDIITKVDDQPIDNALALSRAIASDAPNQTVKLTVWRDGKETTLTATLGTFSAKDDTTKAPTPPQQDDQTAVQSSVGLTVVPNSNGEGLLIQDVDQNSVAADKGFQVGDAILEVDNKKVSTGKEFEDALKAVKDSGRGTALIKAQRDGNVRFIGLPLNSSNG